MTASSSAPQIPCALDLTVKLSARAAHSRCITPLTSSQQPSLTPTPRVDGDFPDTEPVTDTRAEEELPIYRRPRDDSDDEEEDAVTTTEEVVDSEETRERTLLGRFGYTKRKVITNTLQGNIFVADLVKDGNGKEKKERVVVIKKTSKKLHTEHVTVQNGRKFGIYENILKECIILKHLTENRNGLIMTSFTKYENFFDDDEHYYLSMEHGGADLFDFIIEAHELIQAKKLRIKEWRKFSKYLFWQMIVVTQWLHNDMGIAHLDISLENILIKNGTFVPVQDGDETVFTINPNVQIKICDFGLAEIFQHDAASRQRSFQCTKFCGKTNYKAPEVYAKKGVFDARKADVWSLGVVLFCMLVGSPPYNKPIASDQAYLYIKNGIIDQLLFQWERNHFITVKVLSLLHAMLDYDAESRFLVDDVVQHPWLSLYYHKYKGQMTRKSQAQRHKIKKTRARLPFYRLPATATTTTTTRSTHPMVPIISQ